MTPSDLSFVPRRSREALGYTPASDQHVLEDIDASLSHVLSDMRRRKLFPFISLVSVHGQLRLRVALSRVNIAVPVADAAQAWLVLGRAVEFEILADPTAPDLRNPDLLAPEAEAA